MTIRTVLFDLDGTLTDPGEGITNSVAYALKRWGIENTDRRELYCFIGPPLVDSFEHYYGFPHEQAEEAVAEYRVYFRERGMFENRLYEGIPSMLECLKARGVRLVVATSKPEEFAVKILAHFGLLDYFEQVTGATFDGRLSRKADVVTEALRRGGIDPSGAIMVGDRHHDIEGGGASGLKTLGVTYGYGDRAEHEAGGADYIVESVAELERLLVSLTTENHEYGGE